MTDDDSAVVLCEVGPRDGLQNEAQVLPPGLRAELVDRLDVARLPRIEAASFVSGTRVPQMAGAEEVFAGVRDGAARLAGLVLNRRGYDRLAATSCTEARYAFCVTETFNQRNQGRSVADSRAAAAEVVAAARSDGRPASVTLAASFGCPFEGEVDPGHVLGIAEQLAADGVEEVVFADTIGVGVPRQVRTLVTGGRALGLRVGLHLHNTRNNGYANAFAGVEAGVQVLDSSVGGIGGCPFAPAATGNVATEDLVWLLEREGVRTGVDLDELLRVAEWLTGQLRPLPGLLHRAGVFPPHAAAVRSSG